MKTDWFDHDYLIMDEFGRKEIRCMACAKVIGTRHEKPSEKFSKRTFADFMKFPDYCEMPFLLKDNSIAFLMFCDEHCDIEISEENAAKMTGQLQRAKRAEVEFMGRRRKYADQILERFSQKIVVRRMTPEELSERMKVLA